MRVRQRERKREKRLYSNESIIDAKRPIKEMHINNVYIKALGIKGKGLMLHNINKLTTEIYIHLQTQM